MALLNKSLYCCKLNQYILKQIITLIFISLSYVCFGQLEKVVENAINFDDIIEIKDLMYFKADTTLVTGKVIRFNKKKEPKQYIEVVDGKPQNYEWIKFEGDFKNMEFDGLGTLVNAAVGLTGLAMAVAGNDLDIPAQNNSNIFGQNDNGTNIYQSREESYNEKMKFEEEKRMISKNLNSRSKPAIKEDSKPEIEVIENGLYEDFYNSTNLRTRGNYSKGKKVGHWEEWYENGQLKSKMEYLDGKKIGRLDTYHPNGQLKGRVNYVDGKEEGEIMVYNENGEILLIGIFKEGMQAGVWNYFENGKLIKTESFD